MPKALDITNQHFGKLTALQKAASKNGKTYWLCQCDCGNQKEVATTHLTRNIVQSCGHCNENKATKEKYKYCLNCGTKLVNRQTKYCSNQCQQEYQSIQYIQRWLNGEEDGFKGEYGISNHIKNYLFELHHQSCEICGWSQCNPFTGVIPLEIHHKNGNYKDNTLDNLQLLCPNCHSLTENYKGANKSGRPERIKYISRK